MDGATKNPTKSLLPSGSTILLEGDARPVNEKLSPLLTPLEPAPSVECNNHPNPSSERSGSDASTESEAASVVGRSDEESGGISCLIMLGGDCELMGGTLGDDSSCRATMGGTAAPSDSRVLSESVPSAPGVQMTSAATSSDVLAPSVYGSKSKAAGRGTSFAVAGAAVADTFSTPSCPEDEAEEDDCDREDDTVAGSGWCLRSCSAS